jgi:LemA protein
MPYLPWIIAGAIAVVIVIVVMAIYNGLVGRRLETQNAWSQIDVQLKRRYDLIPNLVATVKGYASHERETFERVTQARNQAIAARGPAEAAVAENTLTGALKSLFAVAEAYPELKANQNFLALQEELTSTENKIGFARQHYNDTVSQFNAALQRFPGNVVGGIFGFRSAEFFHLDAAQTAAIQEAPKVQF